MAQFIQLTSWQQFLQKTSQKNAPPLHSCKLFFHISLRFKPSKSHTPNCTWFTEKTSELWLPPVIPSSTPKPPTLPATTPINRAPLPTLKSHRTYGAVAKRLRVFRLKKNAVRGVHPFWPETTLQNKKSTLLFWICVKNIKMSINETNTIENINIYIYMYMYICIYMYNMYICMYIYIYSIHL